MRKFYTYIVTNQPYGVLYVGMTNDLNRRMTEHRYGKLRGAFTFRYNLHRLVYYEIFDYPLQAIKREKQLKAGSRKKKILLIEESNPQWTDLFKGEQSPSFRTPPTAG